jgi:hypothetical protein
METTEGGEQERTEGCKESSSNERDCSTSQLPNKMRAPGTTRCGRVHTEIVARQGALTLGR